MQPTPLATFLINTNCTMKICIAQTSLNKADVTYNIEAHKRIIELALTMNANAIFFPELSLTGYEPELANEVATYKNDNRLNIFQQISDNNKIAIGIGLPTKTETGIRISMVIFQPNQPSRFTRNSSFIRTNFHTLNVVLNK